MKYTKRLAALLISALFFVSCSTKDEEDIPYYNLMDLVEQQETRSGYAALLTEEAADKIEYLELLSMTHGLSILLLGEVNSLFLDYATDPSVAQDEEWIAKLTSYKNRFNGHFTLGLVEDYVPEGYEDLHDLGMLYWSELFDGFSLYLEGILEQDQDKFDQGVECFSLGTNHYHEFSAQFTGLLFQESDELLDYLMNK